MGQLPFINAEMLREFVKHDLKLCSYKKKHYQTGDSLKRLSTTSFKDATNSFDMSFVILIQI